MLHVLFILLKILGILLLCIVGLFLLVLLTPIRYSFGLEKKEQASPEFTVRVSWLFRLFYFKTSYIDKVFDYRVRILGYQIAGNQKEFLEKQKEKQRKKEQKEKKQEEHRKKKESKEANSHKKKESGENRPVTVAEEKQFVKEAAEEDILRIEEISEHSDEKQVSESEDKKEETTSKESFGQPEMKREETENTDSGTDKQTQKKQEKKQEKSSAFESVKNRVRSLKETKANIDKLPWREWVELGKDVLIRFLKHVLPRKLKGMVEFGLSDPADTGYITAIAAIFYPRYGEHFSLYPDFERKMFEAQCKGKGRIRPGYMIVLVVSILKDKSVRTMIKNIILG